MKTELLATLQKSFEEYAHTVDSLEFWYARDLQQLLGYVEWRKFSGVIEKAKEACKKSGNRIPDHFVGADRMVKIGSETERSIDDFMLTRYACYLIAQNGDSRKEEIAFAQSYFAIQTRKQELIEQRIALQERFEARSKLTASETELSQLIYERGVDDAGFARIRSKGDEALFGGMNTSQMKVKLGIPSKRALADFLPTVTIAAKNFATEITNFKVKHNNIQEEPNITGEHVKNNREMRRVLAKNNILPENLPPEEDIQKLQRKVQSEEEKIAESSKRNSQKRLL